MLLINNWIWGGTFFFPNKAMHIARDEAVEISKQLVLASRQAVSVTVL